MKKAKAEGCGATSQGNQTQGIPQRSESDARPRSAPGSEPQIAVRLVNGRYHGERPFAASRCDVSDAGQRVSLLRLRQRPPFGRVPGMVDFAGDRSC